MEQQSLLHILSTKLIPQLLGSIELFAFCPLQNTKQFLGRRVFQPAHHYHQIQRVLSQYQQQLQSKERREIESFQTHKQNKFHFYRIENLSVRHLERIF